MMTNIIDWINTLGLNMPQLSWFKYVLAGVLVLVIIDACLNVLFAGLHTLFSGGKK